MLCLFEHVLSLVSDRSNSTYRICIVYGTLAWSGLNWIALTLIHLPLVNLVGILLLSRIHWCGIALCLWILHRRLIARMQIAFQITWAIAIPELL